MAGAFLGALLIGLREGLEAFLIVGIVSAFLHRTGQSLRPMWTGVIGAVLLSIAVGVGLNMFSLSLPQAQQEAMETIIGLVAVAFVTTMIQWMNRHAFALKGQLEHQADDALHRGGAWALAGMAFLAVLKEGFETSVFLLAAIQASGGAAASALSGAVVGIAGAAALGFAVAVGGARIDLGKFFRVTGVFLILIAAGLVFSALRTAHEAGWVTIGQQQILDLSPLLPAGSIRAAIVTGMFGIERDVRLVEALAWLAYTVPMLAVFLWPQRLRPSATLRYRLHVAGAATLAVGALVLAVAVPRGAQTVTGVTEATTVDSSATGLALDGTLSADATALTLAVWNASDAPDAATVYTLTPVGSTSISGRDAILWRATVTAPDVDEPTTISLQELADRSGGRLPVGLSLATTPGPFAAVWNVSSVVTATTLDGVLAEAAHTSTVTATLSEGGLSSPRLVSLGGVTGDWSTPDDSADQVAQAMASADADATERTLWNVWVPLFLLVAAAALLGASLLRAIREHRTRSPLAATTAPSSPSAQGLEPTLASASLDATKGTVPSHGSRSLIP